MINTEYELAAKDEFARQVAEIDRHESAPEPESVLSRIIHIKRLDIGDTLESDYFEQFSDELDSLSSHFNILDKQGEFRYRKAIGNTTVSILQERIEMHEGRFHDKAEIIGILQAEADSLGETPTSAHLQNEGLMSKDTVQRHFGSCNNAVWAAGLEPNQPEYGKEEMADLARTYLYENGEVPTANDLQNENILDKERIRNKFGAFGNFLAYANLVSDYMATRGIEENRYDEDDYKDTSTYSPNYTGEHNFEAIYRALEPVADRKVAND